ncbi:MAG: PIN domain-containing protein [Euryarchaeota archaeon]|nr:PIN domain-containing protein [Euryarchaeota archaeon]
MRVADTSFIYAALSGLDAHHDDAMAALASGGPVLLPAEIFAETVNLIQRRRGFEDAKRAAEIVAGFTERCHAGAEIDEVAWRIYCDGRGALSYPDAVVLAWCSKLDAKPLSFDKEILRRA